MRCHLPRARPGILGVFHRFILIESVFEVEGLDRCHFRAAETLTRAAETLTQELLDLLQLQPEIHVPGLLGLLLFVFGRRGANYIKGSLGVPHFPYEPQSKHTNATECDNGYRRQEDN